MSLLTRSPSILVFRLFHAEDVDYRQMGPSIVQQMVPPGMQDMQPGLQTLVPVTLPGLPGALGVAVVGMSGGIPVGLPVGVGVGNMGMNPLPWQRPPGMHGFPQGQPAGWAQFKAGNPEFRPR